MNVRIFSVCLASLALSALASPFDAAMLVGLTDKAPTEYRAGENWFGEKGVFFDGGAGADVGKIAQGEKEPADFDAFWARQRKELAKVPVKAKRWEVKSPNDKVRLYAVEIDCVQGSRHGYIPPKR